VGRAGGTIGAECPDRVPTPTSSWVWRNASWTFAAILGRSSPTCGRTFAAELSAGTGHAILVPQSDWRTRRLHLESKYEGSKVSSYYSRETGSGSLWNGPRSEDEGPSRGTLAHCREGRRHIFQTAELPIYSISYVGT